MYLKFVEISIQGFQSIDEVNLSLENQGIVFVQGINSYDSFTDSNGSGKSSIFESIFWTIYGKTTKGVSKVRNRYLDKDCIVTVKFSIEDSNYEITRTLDINDSSKLMVIHNGEDVSGRNKTDTDRYIQNVILKEFTPDIFLSIVFLSQGFNNRLSNLSPAGRKDRLEVLSQISDKIFEFKDQLSSLEKKYDDSLLKIQNKLSSDNGERNSCEKELFRLEQIVEEVKKTSRPNIDLEQTEQKIKSMKKAYSKLKSSYEIKSDSRSEFNTQIKTKRHEQELLTKEINNYEELLKPASKNICPTCLRELNAETSAELIKKYTEEINKLKDKYRENSDVINKYTESLENLTTELNILSDKLGNFEEMIEQLSDLVTEYLKVKDTSDDEKHIEELKEQIANFEIQINNREQEKSLYSAYKGALGHCQNLVSKQFRNYLLEDVINFMNSRLYNYSKLLYSNDSDIIYLRSDASKLDIYLGDAIYDTLSGGEGRKVDLALALAQRDLALNLSGSSSNLLILDEIMDNLDDKAINAVTSMFISVADDIDSMFIISHKPPQNIPYDSMISIVKNSERISSIERS